jgi:hypothetical protein
MRAMNLRSALLGVAIGSTLTVIVYEAGSRIGGDATEETTPAQVSAAESSSPTPQGTAQSDNEELGRLNSEIAALRIQNEKLKAAAGPGGVASAGDGVQDEEENESTVVHELDEEEWRSRYPQTEVDRSIESTIQGRIESHIAALAPDAEVECRSGCCRMSMTADDTDKLMELMGSSVGVGWFPASTTTNSIAGSTVTQALCLGDNAPPNVDEMPNRGIERDALVENALPALSLCAKKAHSAFNLKMTLSIDEDGQISDIDSTEKYSGDASAKCAGAALLTHAVFAPWTSATTIVLEIRLDPKSGASVL